MVRQHQIVLDPQKMAAYGVSQRMVADAVGRANQEAGGASIEIGEAEHIVRASGYLRSDEDFRAIPVKTTTKRVCGHTWRCRVGGDWPADAPRHR
jgi:Cu(I)/Ag(I) efflux system membrane protein CusA/SilA